MFALIGYLKMLKEQISSDCMQVAEMGLLVMHLVPTTASRWYSTVGLSWNVVYSVGVKRGYDILNYISYHRVII